MCVMFLLFCMPGIYIILAYRGQDTGFFAVRVILTPAYHVALTAGLPGSVRFILGCQTFISCLSDYFII